MMHARGKPTNATPGTGTKTAETLALYRRLQSLCGTPHWLVGVTERYDAYTARAVGTKNDGLTPVYAGPVPPTGRKPVAEFYALTGRYPTMCMWEYVDPTQPAAADGVTGAEMHETMIADMIAFGAMGGIICVSDHWGSPAKTYGLACRMDDVAGTQYDAAAQSIPLILTGGAQRAQLTNHVTRFAAAIARLVHPTTGAKLPVIFRPMHEPNSNSFWWASAQDASFKSNGNINATRQSDYKTLWQDLVALVNAAGGTNILWQWNVNCYQSGQGNGTKNSVNAYSGWYPGDSYVDLVSGDYYSDGDDTPSDRFSISGTEIQASVSALLSIAAAAGKPVSLAEIGALQAFGSRANLPERWGREMESSPVLRSLYGAGLWRPPWGPEAGQPSNASLARMAASPYCLTLDKL